MGNTVAALLDLGTTTTGTFIVTRSVAGIDSVWRQVVIGDNIYWERIYSELPAHANYALTVTGISKLPQMHPLLG
jgi:hypothetical protein